MKRIFLLSVLVTLVAGALSCGSREQNGANGDTPTEAYKRLFAAVKSGSPEAVRAEITKKTYEFAATTAKQMGKTAEEQIKYGMTATTYAENLPTTRDERIKDNMAALEVWNAKDSRWEDLPFMIEDGKWKLAYGEAWGRTWHSPGKGRDQREREAANALTQPAGPVANVNVNPKPNPTK